MRLLSALLFALSLCAADYDLLIRNARVLDGTGNPFFYADVGVKDGRIRAIGKLVKDTATRVIDAGGKYLAPGFIDMHSHSDRGVANPELRYNLNMVAQGITLSVLNQDGRSPWPLRKQKELFESQGIGNNVALMAGHGTVRQRVMGQRANQPAAPDDIRGMQQLVEEGMQDGAFGLSTGLEYAPGRFSEPREVVDLTRVVKPYGGVYISHERSEGRDPMWKTASDPTPAVDLLDAVLETINIGRQTRVPVVCSHIKAKGANYWGSSHAAVRLIRAARQEGIEVYADQYTYDTSGSDGSTVLVPLWALAAPGAQVGGQLGEAGRGSNATFRNLKENLRTRLEDPPTGARIRADIEHEIARRGGASRLMVYDFPDAKYNEKSLAWIAGDRGLTPVETALWIQRNGYDRPGGARMRGFSLDETDIDYFMQQDFTATCTDGDTVAFGEGVPHARFYGTYPRKIRRYVIERRAITLPFAVRSMSGLAAQILGLKDRGYIREGFWADLVIFDLNAIADKATFTKPHAYPDGIPYVFVNGVAVVDDTKFTKATPGKVLTPAHDGWRASGRE